MSTTNSSYNFPPSAAPRTTDDQVVTHAPVNENRDLFTKLLVAQIRNQDPLSPSDPSQFVSQLTQLSQTEALENLAQTTAASASMLQNLQVLAMGGQVGTEVSVATEKVRLGEGKISGSVQLEGASNLTQLVLTGVDGKEHKIDLPSHGPGALAFTIDPAALGLPPGNYGIKAIASDGTKPAVEVNGRLDSVRVSASGGVLLQVAGIGDVDPEKITGFKGKTTAARMAALSTDH
ncbi:flagellar hook capping FlgD N-terminal domain-containing protein [Massilia niastensis]|uniref:flagellar hook capping FlgD N-terminal domain-containing protein n=1 Tax=Massilia niastensis TaxID=544911 RepID=UPI0003640B8B|nr:flagellar hook capping FlgD N-terminal domain-containing protein [Massilia niastensis]